MWTITYITSMDHRNAGYFQNIMSVCLLVLSLSRILYAYGEDMIVNEGRRI